MAAEYQPLLSRDDDVLPSPPADDENDVDMYENANSGMVSALSGVSTSLRRVCFASCCEWCFLGRRASYDGNRVEVWSRMDVHEAFCEAVEAGLWELAVENGDCLSVALLICFLGLCAPSQSLRFYAITMVSIINGILGTFLQITLVPKVLVAVLSADKRAIAVAFLWGSSSFIAITCVVSVTQYFAELLALDWRKALTRKVGLAASTCFSSLSFVFRIRNTLMCVFQTHTAYFSGKCLYWLNQVDKRIDNVDQRIAEEYDCVSFLPAFVFLSYFHPSCCCSFNDFTHTTA